MEKSKKPIIEAQESSITEEFFNYGDLARGMYEIADQNDSPLGKMSRPNLIVYATGMKLIKNENEEAASRDNLTGLMNRGAFGRVLEEHYKKSDLPNDFAIIFLDLDNFKRLNDEKGHDTGDLFLKGVANILTEKTRAKTHGKDIVAVGRQGGDEILLLVDTSRRENDKRNPNLSAEEMIDGLKNRLRSSVKKLAESVEINAPFVGVSVGVSYFDPEKTISEMLKEADENMYEDKLARKRDTQTFLGHIASKLLKKFVKNSR